MKYLLQFGIIMAVSFAGELFHDFLPLPVPASIYGILILFSLLRFKILHVAQIKETAMFLISIMAFLFLPAAVGLVVAWPVMKSAILQYIAANVLSLIACMAGTGFSLLENSVYIGVFLSIATFWLGMYLQQKFRSPVLNPLLVSTVLMIGFIKFTGYDYATMDRSLEYINYLLTPATICLAVPLYEQMKTLKNNMPAIFLGIFSGVLSSLVSIFLLCILFGFDHAAYVTLLPKSITTPIGMGISSELGGYVPITVASIIFTGIIGNIAGEYVLKALRITNPIAKGLAMGTSSHGMGTARAMEMGPVEGAMSSLSICIAGIMTVAGATFFSSLL